LNDIIDVKSSLVIFQQNSVGFLSGVAGGNKAVCSQYLFFRKNSLAFSDLCHGALSKVRNIFLPMSFLNFINDFKKESVFFLVPKSYQ
jgi:hypothetical protein